MPPLKGNFGHGKAPSHTLVSRYALGEEIGRGASGLVYKVRGGTLAPRGHASAPGCAERGARPWPVRIDCVYSLCATAGVAPPSGTCRPRCTASYAVGLTRPPPVPLQALNIQTGGMVAIKQVTLRGVSKEQLNLLQQEINLLKLLTNPYIVEYIESFNTKVPHME